MAYARARHLKWKGHEFSPANFVSRSREGTPRCVPCRRRQQYAPGPALHLASAFFRSHPEPGSRRRTALRLGGERAWHDTVLVRLECRRNICLCEREGETGWLLTAPQVGRVGGLTWGVQTSPDAALAPLFGGPSEGRAEAWRQAAVECRGGTSWAVAYQPEGQSAYGANKQSMNQSGSQLLSQYLHSGHGCPRNTSNSRFLCILSAAARAGRASVVF